MDATVLLCDYAVEVQGKLYITGGGWSLLRAGTPADISLAVKLDVPWDRADRPLPLHAALLTEDGFPAPAVPGGEPVILTGEVQVTRPPGLPPGVARRTVRHALLRPAARSGRLPLGAHGRQRDGCGRALSRRRVTTTATGAPPTPRPAPAGRVRSRPTAR